MGVSVTWDKESDARKFAESYHLPYAAGHDGSGAITGAYGLDATPVTIFIDKNGKVVSRRDGEMSEAEFEQQIDTLLATS